MLLFALIRRALSRAHRTFWCLFIVGVELVYRMPSKSPDGAGKNLRRILVVRLDGIGDLVLNTPVLRELRMARPVVEITLLVPECGRSLYETCPYVDELLVIQPALDKRGNPLQSLLAARAFWRTEAKREFDLALSPRMGLAPYLAFILYFSGAPVRLGYSERYSERFTGRNFGLDRFLTRKIFHAKPQHDVLNSLAVLEALGIAPTDSSPELWLQRSDREFVTEVYGQMVTKSEQLLVGMGVGAGAPTRIWPLERQAAVAAWLIDSYDARIVLLGGPNEAEIASIIAKQLGTAALSLAGRTSLRQTAAVIEACNVLLVHDTGILHIGSAVGTPTVEISCHPKSGSPTHPNAPERFGPWHVPHRVLRPDRPRPPCVDGCTNGRQAHCILEIGTETVKDALSELIAEQYGRTANH